MVDQRAWLIQKRLVAVADIACATKRNVKKAEPKPKTRINRNPKHLHPRNSRSLGCLLFQLVTGEAPFPSVGLDLEGLKAKVRRSTRLLLHALR